MPAKEASGHQVPTRASKAKAAKKELRRKLTELLNHNVAVEVDWSSFQNNAAKTKTALAVLTDHALDRIGGAIEWFCEWPTSRERLSENFQGVHIRCERDREPEAYFDGNTGYLRFVDDFASDQGFPQANNVAHILDDAMQLYRCRVDHILDVMVPAYEARLQDLIGSDLTLALDLENFENLNWEGDYYYNAYTELMVQNAEVFFGRICTAVEELCDAELDRQTLRQHVRCIKIKLSIKKYKKIKLKNGVLKLSERFWNGPEHTSSEIRECLTRALGLQFDISRIIREIQAEIIPNWEGRIQKILQRTTPIPFEIVWASFDRSVKHVTAIQTIHAQRGQWVFARVHDAIRDLIENSSNAREILSTRLSRFRIKLAPTKANDPTSIHSYHERMACKVREFAGINTTTAAVPPVSSTSTTGAPNALLISGLTSQSSLTPTQQIARTPWSINPNNNDSGVSSIAPVIPQLQPTSGRSAHLSPTLRPLSSYAAASPGRHGDSSTQRAGSIDLESTAPVSLVVGSPMKQYELKIVGAYDLGERGCQTQNEIYHALMDFFQLGPTKRDDVQNKILPLCQERIRLALDDPSFELHLDWPSIEQSSQPDMVIETLWHNWGEDCLARTASVIEDICQRHPGGRDALRGHLSEITIEAGDESDVVFRVQGSEYTMKGVGGVSGVTPKAAAKQIGQKSKRVLIREALALGSRGCYSHQELTQFVLESFMAGRLVEEILPRAETKLATLFGHSFSLQVDWKSFETAIDYPTALSTLFEKQSTHVVAQIVSGLSHALSEMPSLKRMLAGVEVVHASGSDPNRATMYVSKPEDTTTTTTTTAAATAAAAAAAVAAPSPGGHGGDDQDEEEPRLIIENVHEIGPAGCFTSDTISECVLRSFRAEGIQDMITQLNEKTIPYHMARIAAAIGHTVPIIIDWRSFAAQRDQFRALHNFLDNNGASCLHAISQAFENTSRALSSTQLPCSLTSIHIKLLPPARLKYAEILQGGETLEVAGPFERTGVEASFDVSDFPMIRHACQLPQLGEFFKLSHEGHTEALSILREACRMPQTREKRWQYLCWVLRFPCFWHPTDMQQEAINICRQTMLRDPTETFIKAWVVFKISRRDKEQERIVLVSDKYLYIVKFDYITKKPRSMHRALPVSAFRQVSVGKFTATSDGAATGGRAARLARQWGCRVSYFHPSELGPSGYPTHQALQAHQGQAGSAADRVRPSDPRTSFTCRAYLPPTQKAAKRHRAGQAIVQELAWTIQTVCSILSTEELTPPLEDRVWRPSGAGSLWARFYNNYKLGVVKKPRGNYEGF